MASDLESAREHYRRRAWQETHAAFVSAEAVAPLGGDDLEMLAASAYMLGSEDDFIHQMGRAHHAHEAAGAILPAIRTAAWAGIASLLRGEIGSASGWFGRANRLLASQPEDCAERGYLLLPEAIRASLEGRHDTAGEMTAAVAELARRHGDDALFALAVCEQGRARIRQGRSAEGLALLDEAMVTVTTRDVTPMVTGIAYCSVIAGCHEAFALQRAGEWTTALTRWCDDQPDLVTFTGQCHVHRAEILQLHGSWDEATAEALRSLARFEGAAGRDPGRAHLRLAELHRLRGRFSEAAEAYREAARFGGETQPGLTLLRLAEGEIDSAVSSIGRALAEAVLPMDRARLLPAAVEVHIAAGDLGAAASAAVELGSTAENARSPHLDSLAAQASGSVSLAQDDGLVALASLRRAAQTWLDLDAPYELARVRVLIGLACRILEDQDTADLEFAAARDTFARLGALPDLRALERLTREKRDVSFGLTDRELEVLRLVAGGDTNKQIADRLYLSVKTVDRHVSNIFTKLGVASRTAATGFAYEHGLT